MASVTRDGTDMRKCVSSREQEIVFQSSSRKSLTNIKLKGINKSIHKGKGGERRMACGMKHPKAKKATKKTSKKKK